MLLDSGNGILIVWQNQELWHQADVPSQATECCAVSHVGVLIPNILSVALNGNGNTQQAP